MTSIKYNTVSIKIKNTIYDTNKQPIKQNPTDASNQTNINKHTKPLKTKYPQAPLKNTNTSNLTHVWTTSSKVKTNHNNKSNTNQNHITKVIISKDKPMPKPKSIKPQSNKSYKTINQNSAVHKAPNLVNINTQTSLNQQTNEFKTSNQQNLSNKQTQN